jgi:hypothetical protein
MRNLSYIAMFPHRMLIRIFAAPQHSHNKMIHSTSGKGKDKWVSRNCYSSFSASKMQDIRFLNLFSVGFCPVLNNQYLLILYKNCFVQLGWRLSPNYCWHNPGMRTIVRTTIFKEVQKLHAEPKQKINGEVQYQVWVSLSRILMPKGVFKSSSDLPITYYKVQNKKLLSQSSFIL